MPPVVHNAVAGFHPLRADQEAPTLMVTALSSVSPAANDATTPSVGAKAHDAFTSLEEWALSDEVKQLPIHQVEREIADRSREVIRLLIQAHLDRRGNGDVGRAIAVVDPESPDNVLLFTHRREADRDHRTLFGKVEVRRLAYSCPGERQLCPVDSLLSLQERSYSYEMQKLVVLEDVTGSYDEAAARIERYTGQKIAKLTCEEVLQEAAVDFEAFYAERTQPDPSQTSSILVGTSDGKGIPMRKPVSERALAGAPVERRQGKKRMATVAAAYTVAPRVRTPEEVTESLFRDLSQLRALPASGGEGKPARPEDKRIFASLDNDKDTVMTNLSAELERRDPDAIKTRVAITDGEKALQLRARKYLPTFTLILDLLHVLIKLWAAAAILVGDAKNLKAERQAWVRERVLRILQGDVSEVVRGIRQSVTKRKLKGENAKKLRTIAAYLYRNRDYMRYDQFLAAGLPIASGVIEGACKNLINDRMERSGMRWCWTTEAMLRMRAVYLSGDFEEYWKYHIAASQKRLHSRTWTAAAA